MRNNDCSKTLLSYFRSTQKKKQMKIAISGATGFIGTHLTRYLSGQGHEVTGLGRKWFVGEMPIIWQS